MAEGNKDLSPFSCRNNNAKINNNNNDHDNGLYFLSSY